MMRALMEMKHLGSTLRATVYAPSPQVLGLTEHSAQYENRWRACVCACIQCIHDGTQGEAVPCEGDPSGEEEEGEATCLLAVAKRG